MTGDLLGKLMPQTDDFMINNRTDLSLFHPIFLTLKNSFHFTFLLL